MAEDIWKLFSYYENLGYLWPYEVGFKQITYLVLKLEHFEKKMTKKLVFWGQEKCSFFSNFEYFAKMPDFVRL